MAPFLQLMEAEFVGAAFGPVASLAIGVGLGRWQQPSKQAHLTPLASGMPGVRVGSRAAGAWNEKGAAAVATGNGIGMAPLNFAVDGWNKIEEEEGCMLHLTRPIRQAMGTAGGTEPAAE